MVLTTIEPRAWHIAGLWQAGITALALLVSGCHVVYSVQPLGDKPQAIVPADWEGTWLHPDGAITVAVTDKDKGLLEVGWVEVKQNRLAVEKYQVELRASGDWMFGNLADTDGEKRYFWARLKKEARQLVMWMPDPAKVKALIEQGALPGRIINKGEDVVLESLSAAQLGVITKGQHGSVLDLDSPLVFFRYSE